MDDGVLIAQVTLAFNKRKVRADLSCVAHTPDGHLWLASDEFTTLERLSPAGANTFAQHRQFEVSDYVDLKDAEAEIDTEGMDFSDGYLWLVGSHSTKRKSVKGKGAEQDIQRLLEVTTDLNRYLLARIPIVDGEPVKEDEKTGRVAARLKQKKESNALTQALEADEHIGPFLKMKLPSKENGFDIEALAAKGNRLFLGLRGPVLRGMAIILEVEIDDTRPSENLQLKRLENGRCYRKHFVDLDGLGVRDLCFEGEDLIILAGATMQLSVPMQIFSLRKVLNYQKDTLSLQKSDVLTKRFELPWTVGADNAEGITLVPYGLCDRQDDEKKRSQLDEKQRDADTRKSETDLMVVYDSPSDQRLKDNEAVLADIFCLSEVDESTLS